MFGFANDVVLGLERPAASAPEADERAEVGRLAALWRRYLLLSASVLEGGPPTRAALGGPAATVFAQMQDGLEELRAGEQAEAGPLTRPGPVATRGRTRRSSSSC